MAELIHITTDEEYAVAASLFSEYAEWLKIDLCFQHFSEELENLRVMYSPPTGTIILSRKDDTYNGCVAVRKIDHETAELKRMYVRPRFQKQGTGTSLLTAALEFAKKAGYKRIRLDTLNTMTPAIKLYKQYGFYEIHAYYYNPEITAMYFEKLL